jgi:hypothetical protein
LFPPDGNVSQNKKEGLKMKKQIVCLLVCSAFVISAWGETAFGQTKIMKAPLPVAQDVKTLQAAALKAYKPSPIYPQANGSATGMASVYKKTETGEVWLMAMYGSAAGAPTASAGFTSNTLRNAGTLEWSGVTMTATIEVHKCHGPFHFTIEPFGSNSQNPIGTATNYAMAPGTYKITSQPFVMKPNTDYYAVAFLVLTADSAPTNEAISCYAKITSITFNFP